MRSRRVKAFLNEFPNALDVIVRAVKSGLPLNDGIRLIATESAEPVRTEFRRIVEAQQVGLSIPEAAMRMGETMPCPEASFFGIVIQIQQQAGGNLSEALGNLSRVIRDRKKMKARVQALSMEAKASAIIIGALPFVVAFLVYLTSPTYIMPLFTTSTGNLILGCLRSVDVDRRPGDAQDDELRSVGSGHDRPSRKSTARSVLPYRHACRHCGFRDCFHRIARAERGPYEGPHEGGRARARRTARQAADAAGCRIRSPAQGIAGGRVARHAQYRRQARLAPRPG